jgi:hypothetical protein
LLFAVIFVVAFLVVIPSVASEPAVSRSLIALPIKQLGTNWMAELVLPHNLCGNTNEKRETAGSLATLGMTTRKARAKTKQKPETNCQKQR